MTFCNVKQSRCSNHDAGGFAIGTGGGFSIVIAGGFGVGIGGGYQWNTHEGCEAPITAANLDKLRQDMVYDPYYKAVDAEDHSVLCPYRNEVETVSKIAKGDNANTTRGKLDSDLADVFGFKRPPSHFETVVSTLPEYVTKNFTTNKKRTKSSAKTKENRPSTHYFLLSFVSKYSRYLKQGTTTRKFICINKFNVSYADMFVEVKGQRIENISDYSRVYFGKAEVSLKCIMPPCAGAR